ncbi:ketoreductase [Patulibacter medicamentivorans]|uniref:Ketoreductase n=1 Tax=Patulibacter medicamentivorans TaxID=1097667 RepID=H0E6J6_9ACTN|nr:SDR family oxidoreductase [Patulibacter medicamentivorans]EHN10695.1 ketoreductase [Patulibacter medicamentivorans]
MDLELTGETIVVTGATSGIGAAVTRRLAEEGAHVLLVARDEQRLRAAVAGLPGGPHAFAAVDVGDLDAGERIVAAALAELGRLDAVVMAAGASRRARPEELTEADWEQQWRLNVLAPQRLLLAASDALVSAPRGGRAVLVSSSSGKRPSPGNMAYGVTKSAQLALSRAWADHLAPRGVRVNAVAPGPIDGEMWLQPGGLADQAAAAAGVTREQALESARARVPLRRFGTPDEIADAIVLLASHRAGFTAGAAWSVDGGSVPFYL